MATILKNENLRYVPAAWESVNCPFCNNEQAPLFEKFGPENLFSYVKCDNCSLIYLNPRPVYDADFVNIAYHEYDTDSFFFKSKGALGAAETKLVAQYNLILCQIEKQLNNQVGSLLEIGCMTGLFLKTARDRGWSVVGVDISKKMIDHIGNNLGIESYCRQYQDLDLQGRKFDVIYCSHVIEHIPNPNEWFIKFKKDIKKDGLLCINVPNQNSLDRILKRFFQKIIDRRNWADWRTPDHLFEPTKASMRYILKKHGFNVANFFSYSNKEAQNNSLFSTIFHKYLKLGSKLRFFATP